MNGVKVSVCPDKDIAQGEDDGQAQPLQVVLEAWLAIPPGRRRDVLRGLWLKEQRAIERSTDMRATGDAAKHKRKRARYEVQDTRAARYLLRAISKAMDPNYDKPAATDGQVVEVYRRGGCPS